MECWIEHPQNPKELILVWQAPAEFVSDRLRWAVGRLTSNDGSDKFEYFAGSEFRLMNLGRTEDELRACGFTGYPAFGQQPRHKGPKVVSWDNALQTFLRRVPPRSRSDFPAYLAHHKIKAVVPLSAMALLGVTEAHLPSDGFSLVDPLDVGAASVDFVFEIAGFRHSKPSYLSLEDGLPLTLAPEPANRWDPAAIQVLAGDVRIGYVNRLQAASIARWLITREVLCWIARLNGPIDKPRAYAFASVRPIADAMAA